MDRNQSESPKPKSSPMGDDTDVYGPIRNNEEPEQASSATKIEASDASKNPQKKMTRLPEKGGSSAERKEAEKTRSETRQTSHQLRDVKTETFPPPPGVLSLSRMSAISMTDMDCAKDS